MSSSLRPVQVYAAVLNHGSVSDEAAFRAGLQPVKEWRAFSLRGFPGTELAVSC